MLPRLGLPPSLSFLGLGLGAVLGSKTSEGSAAAWDIPGLSSAGKGRVGASLVRGYRYKRTPDTWESLKCPWPGWVSCTLRSLFPRQGLKLREALCINRSL